MKKNTINLLIKAVVAGIALCVIAIFAVKADAQTGARIDGPVFYGIGNDGRVRTPALKRLRYTVNHR
jgi:hypothetical protein